MSKILIADDNDLNRELITEILSSRAECIEANNGVEAVDIYKKSKREKTPFDLILLDISMPGMDGVNVLKKIRDIEQREGILEEERIPIIMVTSYTEPQLRSFNMGCDDYIVGPVSKEVLINKVEEKLRRRNSFKNNFKS